MPASLSVQRDGAQTRSIPSGDREGRAGARPGSSEGRAGENECSLPRHVAIIMDGNGRWANSRGLPRVFGHRAGAQAVRRVVEAACEFGLPALTLYAFSWENRARPSGEVQAILGAGGLIPFLKVHPDWKIQ